MDREAHSYTEKTLAIRRRSIRRDLANNKQIQHAEQHYLLLNVRRLNVLRDVFDQLWQRRKQELRRPLRVRLGEADALEIGHDLGGVQIEFFNLVCREIFSEQARELYSYCSKAFAKLTRLRNVHDRPYDRLQLLQSRKLAAPVYV